MLSEGSLTVVHRLLVLLPALAALSLVAFGSAEVDGPESTLDEAFLSEARELLDAPELPAAPLPEGDLPLPAGIFLSEPDDRAVRVLRTAEKYRAQGKWSDALTAYQVLIDDGVGSDFPATEGVYVPVHEYCRRRMISLPPEAIKTYRTLHDAAALALYDNALGMKSPGLLREAADRYPISSVALQCLKDAADLQLEQGDYASALATCRLLFSRLRAGARPGFSPMLILVKAAACLRALGQVDRADGILDFVKSPGSGVPKDKVMQWAEAVKALRARPPAPANWGTFGGNNSHSRSPGKVALPGRLRWYQQVKEQNTRPGRPREVARPGGPLAPKMVCRPVALGGVVYYRTQTSVAARDILRGEELWAHREELLDRRGRPLNRMPYYAMNKGSLFLTAVRDKVYANVLQVCYDDQRMVYRFKLVALDARPEKGKPRVAWERGGGAEKDNEVRLLSFTSAPIVSDDKLFVGAMRAPGEDIYLCAFDAENGDLLWKTFICAGAASLRSNYRTGNGAAEMPAEKDGIVYLALNVGVVAAVDADTGRVLWKNVYEQIPRNLAPGRYYTSRTRPNNPPIISDGKLYLLPTASEFLHAIDTGTGKLEWRHPLGNDYSYLLGVKDGSIVVSGSRVASISVDGSSRWSHSLDGEPSGRGVLAEDFALCPTKAGIELVRLETGRFAGVERPYASWSEWLALQKDLQGIVQSGNLLITDGKLVIAGEDRVQVYDERVDPEQVLAKLKKTPNSPVLRAELASYYVWQGQYAEAVREYEIAHEIIVREGGRKRLAKTILGDLFTLYMDMGDSATADASFGKALAGFRQALGRAPHREAELQARVKIAETHTALRDVTSAIDALQTIITEYSKEYFHPDGYLFVQARAFAEARIAELLKRYGREHYAAYDAKVEEVLRTAPDNAAAARRILREFPNSRSLAQCLLTVAKRAINEENYPAAGGYLALLLRRRPEAAQADEARDLLTLCLERQGIAAHGALPARANIFPPLERRWSFKIDVAEGFAQPADVFTIGGSAAAGDALSGLFYAIQGKNIQCRRAHDGSLAWKNSAGWLGVSLHDPGPQVPGTEILDVLPETPALAAGFERGDRIVEFDGAPVDDTATLIRICGNTPSGKQVKVKVLRRGRQMALRVKLGERPVMRQDAIRGYQVFFAGMAAVGPQEEESDDRGRGMVISRDRFIQCLDPVTGQVIRKFPAGVGAYEPFSPTQPTPRDGLAIVREKKLLSLTPGSVERLIIPGRPGQTIRKDNEAALWDIATGRELWKRSLGRRPVSDPHVVGDVAVVIETETGHEVYVTCYSLVDGSEIASIGPNNARGAPLGLIELAGGRICVAIGRDIFCYGITGDGEKAGRRIWARHVGAAELKAFRRLPSAEKHGKELIMAATENLGVEVIEADTGRSLWSLAPRGGLVLQKVAVDEDGLYVCSRAIGEAEAHIEAFSIETGRSKWRLAVDGMPYATGVLVTDSHVVVALNQADPRNLATGPSKVLVLDKTSGKVIQEIALKDKTVHALKVVDGFLLIITHDSVIGLGSREPRT